MGAKEKDAEQNTSSNTSDNSAELPEGAQWAGAQPGQGDPGMLGPLGTEPLPGIPSHTSQPGVPTEPGTVGSAGTMVPPDAVSTADTMKQADIYGVPGRMGHAYTNNTDPGTPGVSGTPVPGGPLRGDPTPPEMPDYGRVGEEGFKATLEGTDSGVATGSSPIMRNPERTEAESSFNRYTGSPVMGVTSQDMDGEETDRGVTDPEEPDRQREREAYAGDADGRQSQDFGNGTANPDGLTTVIDAPEPGANK